MTEATDAAPVAPTPVRDGRAAVGNPEEAVSSVSQAAQTGTGQEIVLSVISLETDFKAYDQYLVDVTIRNPTPDRYTMPIRVNTRGTLRTESFTGPFSYSRNYPPFTADPFTSVTYGLYLYGPESQPLKAPDRFAFVVTDLNSGVQLSGTTPSPCVFDAPDSDFWWTSLPIGDKCYCGHYGTWQLTNSWSASSGVWMDRFTCQ